MSESVKLKCAIIGHMTKDARITVRNYIKPLNASILYRVSKQELVGRKNLKTFRGEVTITKATKEHILSNKPDIFREINVISELSLCAFLCFAGLPRHNASGWILDNVQQNEFEPIEDIQTYLMDKAMIWKMPKHVTEYKEFKGKVSKKLKKELDAMKAEQLALRGPLLKNTNKNIQSYRKRTSRKQRDDEEEWKPNEDDLKILCRGGGSKRKRKKPLPKSRRPKDLSEMGSYWQLEPPEPKKRRFY